MWVTRFDRRDVARAPRTKTCAVALAITALLAPRHLIHAEDGSGDRRPLEAWLAPETIVYAKAHDLRRHLDRLLASDLFSSLKESPIGDMVRSDPKAKRLFAALRAIEAKRIDTLALLRALFGREVAIGASLTFDGPDVVLLTRAESSEALAKALETIERVVTNQIGYWPALEIERHGDVAIHGNDKLVWAAVGDVLVLSNRVRGVKRAIDLGRDPKSKSVSNNDAFRSVRGDLGPDTIAGIAVRPSFLPNWRLPERVENIVASLLASPWIEALRKSEAISLSLRPTENGVALEVSASVDGEKLRRDWPGFFPDGAEDPLVDRIVDLGSLAVVEIRRDLARVWEDAERLVEAKGIGEMRELAQILTLIFSRSFVDEILPEFRPELLLVARAQDYAKLGATPVPEIPGFALVFGLEDAARFSRHLQGALQSLVGIMNADRASKKKGGGMFLVEAEKVGDAKIFAVTTIEEKDAGPKPGIEHNFSPALATVGERVVLSSSRDLCEKLVGLLPAKAEPSGATTAARSSPDRLVIDGRGVRDIVLRNRDVLIANEMLEKSKSREEATEGIDALLSLLGWIRRVELTSGLEGDRMRLQLGVDLGDGDSGEATARTSVSKTSSAEDEQ